MAENLYARYDRKKFYKGPGNKISKFSTLPGISNSPTPTDGNQVIPYETPRNGITPRNNGNMDTSIGVEADERMRQLETRINVSEKSNRALLEEVVRLQSELKTTLRRNEELIREERQARSQFEQAQRQNNDVLTQIQSRLERTEDKVNDEHSAVSTLMNHTKNVEQTVLSSQQELLSRRDMQTSKIQDLRTELDEQIRNKEQLERSTFALNDELRQMKSKLETQRMDFNAVTQDLKNRAKKLEDDTRQSMDAMRKHGEHQSTTEQGTMQLRGQVENRLAELRDVILDLRNKVDQETQERRILEQSTQLRTSELSSALAEQNRRREEALHALEVMQREKEHAAETERIKLQSKIAEIAEEVSKKILQKEMKLREENASKYAQLEDMVQSEKDTRQRFEREIKKDLEHRFDDERRNTDEEIQSLKEQTKKAARSKLPERSADPRRKIPAKEDPTEKSKSNDKFHKLNDALGLLEKQMETTKKQHDKVLAAEVKSRTQHEREMKQKMQDMNEKLAVATATLQQGIGGVQGQVHAQGEKLKRELRTLLDDSMGGVQRQLADMDTRITSTNNKIQTTEESLEAKIAARKPETKADDDKLEDNPEDKQNGDEEKKYEEAATENANTLKEKVDAIALWQEVTQQTLKELQNNYKKLPDDISGVTEKQKLLKLDVDTKINSEADARIKDVQYLNEEIEKIKSAKPADDNNTGGSFSDQEAKDAMKKYEERLEETNQSIRKLAESIQTVKTVLGMKIQSEQKLRAKDVEKVQDQIDTLRLQVEPYLNLSPQPRVYVKPPGYEDQDRAKIEKKTKKINRWSMYNTYRYCKVSLIDIGIASSPYRIRWSGGAMAPIGHSSIILMLCGIPLVVYPNVVIPIFFFFFFYRHSKIFSSCIHVILGPTRTVGALKKNKNFVMACLISPIIKKYKKGLVGSVGPNVIPTNSCIKAKNNDKSLLTRNHNVSTICLLVGLYLRSYHNRFRP